MRFVVISLALLSISIASVAAPPEDGSPQPKVRDAVPDRFVPAPYETQKIGGLLGERMQVNLEKRLRLLVTRSKLIRRPHSIVYKKRREWV